MPRPVSLSLDLLQTFVTLVSNDGDATETATILGVNQPSMSKRLGYLQHAGRVLHQPWLVREGKKWKLTDEGQKALPAVKEIIHRYQQLTQFLEAPGVGRPHLHFGCGQLAATGFVRQAIHQFRREFPRARLRISTVRGRERILRVANGSLDLAAVTHGEDLIRRIARRPLHVEQLCLDRWALVCAEQAPWSSKVRKLPRDRVSPEALAGFPLILPEGDAGLRRDLDKVLQDRDLLGKLDQVLEIGGWGAILSYVREGDGVGVVSEAALGDADGLVVRYLIPELFPPIATRLICRRYQGTGAALDLSDEAEAFRQALRKAARKRGE